MTIITVILGGIIMMKRTYSQHSKTVMNLLAKQIQLGRKQRGWSEQELATRAGISRATVQKIEKADPGVAVGLVFECAFLVGVTLFAPEKATLVTEMNRLGQYLSLFPKRTHPQKIDLDDNF